MQLSRHDPGYAPQHPDAYIIRSDWRSSRFRLLANAGTIAGTILLAVVGWGSSGGSYFLPLVAAGVSWWTYGILRDILRGKVRLGIDTGGMYFGSPEDEEPRVVPWHAIRGVVRFGVYQDERAARRDKASPAIGLRLDSRYRPILPDGSANPAVIDLESGQPLTPAEQSLLEEMASELGPRQSEQDVYSVTDGWTLDWVAVEQAVRRFSPTTPVIDGAPQRWAGGCPPSEIIEMVRLPSTPEP